MNEKQADTCLMKIWYLLVSFILMLKGITKCIWQPIDLPKKGKSVYLINNRNKNIGKLHKNVTKIIKILVHLKDNTPIFNNVQCLYSRYIPFFGIKK